MHPLLLSSDSALIDEVVRLAAAAGVQPTVSADPATALVAWSEAPLVLVGCDVVEAVAALAPPRRSSVHVVGQGRVPDGVFRSAVSLGAASVAELPRSQGWLVEQFTEVGDPAAQGTVLGVIGGAGGSGATTLACALAQVAAARGSVLLADTDPLGPGLDRLLGMEGLDGVSWGDLGETTGRLSARSLRDSVPRVGDLGVLTWRGGVDPATRVLQPFVAREVVAAARRGHDLTLLDLARGGGPLVAELASRCDRLLVLCRSSLAGVASTIRLVESLGAATAHSVLIARPGDVPEEEVESAVGLPVALMMKDDRGVAEAVDLGLGPVRSRRSPIARVARQVLEAA